MAPQAFFQSLSDFTDDQKPTDFGFFEKRIEKCYFLLAAQILSAASAARRFACLTAGAPANESCAQPAGPA